MFGVDKAEVEETWVVSWRFKQTDENNLTLSPLCRSFDQQLDRCLDAQKA